ncbi:MAG: uroporphyrinogen-III synthase [Propionibacteriaceae bacterium]
MRVLMPQPLGALAQAVTAAGAEVIGLELTRMIVDEQARAEAIATLAEYDWVVLSSARTAELLGAALAGIRVAAVGAATATAARSYGACVELVPVSDAGAAALCDIFPAGNGRVLIPGSALAAPLLAQHLTQQGWDVVQLAIYTIESVVPQQVPAVDIAVATAGSTASALAGLDIPVVALGDPSAQVATAAGLRVLAVAENSDAASLVAGLISARKDIR